MVAARDPVAGGRSSRHWAGHALQIRRLQNPAFLCQGTHRRSPGAAELAGEDNGHRGRNGSGGKEAPAFQLGAPKVGR